METGQSASSALGQACRRVTTGVIAGVHPNRDIADVSRWLDDQPEGRRNLIVSATLAGLLGASILFAQFGALGILVFFLIVILLIR